MNAKMQKAAMAAVFAGGMAAAGWGMAWAIGLLPAEPVHWDGASLELGQRTPVHNGWWAKVYVVDAAGERRIYVGTARRTHGDAEWRLLQKGMGVGVLEEGGGRAMEEKAQSLVGAEGTPRREWWNAWSTRHDGARDTLRWITGGLWGGATLIGLWVLLRAGGTRRVEPA